MSNTKHMRWWVWLLAAVQCVAVPSMILRGGSVWLVAFGACTGGAIFGFALRDWAVDVDLHDHNL